MHNTTVAYRLPVNEHMPYGNVLLGAVLFDHQSCIHVIHECEVVVL